jgi:putative transposase
MPNTYTQIHIQAVFVVKNRECIISKTWEDELYKYILGIIKANNHKPVSINGVGDHIHVLFGMRPSQSLSDLMQDVKAGSSIWINERKFIKGKFAWQEGYGAFSYSKSQLPVVINYINNQKEHHKKKKFLDEYKDLLESFGIEYDDRFVFKSVLD